VQGKNNCKKPRTTSDKRCVCSERTITWKRKATEESTGLKKFKKLVSGWKKGERIREVESCREYRRLSLAAQQLGIALGVGLKVCFWVNFQRKGTMKGACGSLE